MSSNFLNATVEDLIKGKFGDEIGGKVIKAIQACLKEDAKLAGTALIDCAISRIKEITVVEQEAIWDFLYHFVIVG